MIRYLLHDQIDKSRWDDCIAKSVNSLVYAYSWYLDMASPGWDALVDEYESVFPLPQRSKFGFRYVFPPYFIQQLGLFSKAEITEKRLNAFLDAIPEKFKLVELNLNWKNNFLTPGFMSAKNITHHLELNQPYEAIRKSYSENLKRNLKKASASDQKIIETSEVRPIVELFRKARGKTIHKLKDADYDTFARICEACISRNSARIYTSWNEKHELTAGVVFFQSHRRFIFIFSGASAEAKEKFSVPLLLDHFIRTYCNSEGLLDFEGSNDPDLSRFYRGFGAKEILYLQIRKNSLPFPLNYFKK